VAYVIERVNRLGKSRFMAMYWAEDGQARSAGTFDNRERAEEVAAATELHARLKLAETSPADRATITLTEFSAKFLLEHAVEPNTKETYAQLLRCHVLPYMGGRRVAEVSRETMHRLLTVVLPEAEVSKSVILNVRTCLSALMQMAWDHGYRQDNPLRGIKLKRGPRKSIIVASSEQFGRVYKALPHDPAKVFARLGVATGARYCELISFVPEDFDFDRCMVSINKSTVEVSSEFHPQGYRFLTRAYTKNGEHRRFKIDKGAAEMVRQHIIDNGIGSGELIFPVRLFATRKVSNRLDLTEAEIEDLGFTEPLPSGKTYRHGTLGAYVTAKCRCEPCKAWSADYGRSGKRRRTGRGERQWSAGMRRDPTEYMSKHTWRRIWSAAVTEAGLQFAYTPYQVRHTDASWLIDKGVDIERVKDRLGHGDLTTTTRYVKILDEEDPAAADVMDAIMETIAA